MATVKQQVLDWLYSILTSDYRNVNRTYSDVAQLLSQYSSLSPRTDVYTYNNGRSALLLHISGTISVVFRGTCYRFPIAIWVPHLYPTEAPMIYVTAAEGMIVRPGQHVDLQGKVYHPYLVRWAENSDTFNFLDFLDILRDVFAKEPPVISRPQSSISHGTSTTHSGTIEVVPKVPFKDKQALPPPPPPRPKKSIQQLLPLESPKWGSDGPPIPPLPRRSLTENTHNNYHNHSSWLTNNLEGQNHNNMNHDLAYTTTQLNQSQNFQKSHDSVDISSPSNQIYQNYLRAQPNTNQALSSSQSKPHYPYQQILSYPQGQPDSPQFLNPPSPQEKHKTPPDLLSTPLVLTIPSPSSIDCHAPPIPPNPEKDLLLQKISHELSSQRQQAQDQMNSSLQGLQSQRNAMLTSLERMKAEIHALESLNHLLTSNTDTLHTALKDADDVIISSQHRKLPSIDELLVAPNLVSNQLYRLVSEERSLGDTIFVLSRAVERGRISAVVFAKMTRSLSREWYLKKALVRKIGIGMGLSAH